METSTILTIVAVIVTITVGYIGIRFALRPGDRGKLTFFEESCVGLFNSIVESVDGLEVNYEGQPISKNVVMLKACIVNTGPFDIDKSIVHQPLTVSLPSNFRWLKARVVASSPGVEAGYGTTKPNELFFTWGLLKRDEFIRFHALVETPRDDDSSATQTLSPARRVSKSIKFSQRISNLRCVDKTAVPFYSRSKLRRRAVAFASSGVYLLLGLAILFISLVRFSEEYKEVQYSLRLEDGRSIHVLIVPGQNDELIMKEVGGDYLVRVNPKDFFSYQLEPVVRFKRARFYTHMSFSLLLMILASVLFFSILRESRMRRKLDRLLAETGDAYLT